MPRAILDTPLAMRAGTAVTHASPNAAKTRNRLQYRCSESGLPPWMSPLHACPKLVSTFSGVGRNRSLIQPKWVATHQRAKSAITVTMLMAVLDPSPGTLYPLTARIGGGSAVSDSGRASSAFVPVLAIPAF